ncbi:MAG: glycosyltransferase [Verrucomicrobia bacterium]|jgi:cellulose synthase/poly-beta-1,6-N-acetylglucosamine synthase-like glycosyltransferase|nr:glycosyltransferase [Verrucomicrobiota bacterium]
MIWVFLVLVALLLYTFVLFPLAMAVVSLFERSHSGDCEPTVAILVPARNEGSRIATKIRNTLEADYPREKIKLIVASDGSTDETVSEIRPFAEQGVQLVELTERVGKTEAVNRMAELSDSEILVFTDADVLVAPSALKMLVSRFADPDVGAVCARRAVDAGTAGCRARMQQIQKSYETVIKRGEGVLGRVMGGDGSLYAVRASMFRRVPSDVPDDFVAVLRVLKSGMKVAYEAVALAQEKMPDHDPEGLARRRRTVARGIKGLWRERELLNPFRFPLCAFLLFSHKILRWLGGCLMIGLFLANLALATHPLFVGILVLQLCCYFFACLRFFVKGLGAGGVLAIIPYFVLSNLGATLGVMDVVSQRDWTLWQTQR